MTIRTHKQAGDNGVVIDNGSPTQSNSLGPSTIVYFPMGETASPLVDVGAAGIEHTAAGTTTPAGYSNVVGAGDDSFSTRLLQFDVRSSMVGTMPDIDDKDFVLFFVGKARDDPDGGAPAGSGGGMSVYFGNSGVALSEIRCQLYLGGVRDLRVFTDAIFGGDSGDAIALMNISTPTWTPGFTRTEGQVYGAATVKRGNIIEHWVDGVKRGEQDWRTFLPKSQTYWSNYWDDIQLGNDVFFSHAKYNESSVWEYAQDYYGAMFRVFDTAPDDIASAMVWMKTEWQSDNKIIWPGWMSLL